jgi:FAD/FMN-containing dehydrogenase
MQIFLQPEKAFTNVHDTFTVPVAKIYALANEKNLSAIDGYNDSTRSLQGLILEAINDKTSIRALGAGWSFTKVATCPGIMLDTKSLNSRFTIGPRAVSPAYQGETDKLFFVQCGMSVWELNEWLRDRDRSLKTCGASNGQTLAGSMSTCTHGSALDVGSIPDYIVGLHLVVSPTRHIFLERASYPVASDSLIADLKTEIIRDDELFNAALVSFGSFGIIHGIMLETEKRYLLECYRKSMPVDKNFRNALQTLDFNAINLPVKETPYHFQVVINPYDKNNNALVTTMYKKPYVAGYKPPVPNNAGIGPGDDLPTFVGKLANVLPALVPTVVTTLINSNYAPYDKQTGTLGEIFDNTDTTGEVMSMGIGIPLEMTTQVLDIAAEVNKAVGPFVGVFAFRYVKGTKATLGFTKFARTCVVEFDSVSSASTDRFYNAICDALEQRQVPHTVHWGKINRLDAAGIRKMYGASFDKWMAARNKILDKTGKVVFGNELTDKWGIN